MDYWVKYLEAFFQGMSETTIDYHENGFPFITSSKVLGLKITLTSRHGFLGIKFPNKITRDKFMRFSIIDQNIEQLENARFIETNWDISLFPCRVYVNNNRIQFYDRINELSKTDELEKREIVLRSVLNSLIELKQHQAHFKK